MGQITAHLRAVDPVSGGGVEIDAEVAVVHDLGQEEVRQAGGGQIELGAVEIGREASRERV